MANYNITYQDNSEYEIIVHSISHHNPVYAINEISEEISKSINGRKKVLFDLLLTNGNEFNRFAECSYDGRHLVFDSIKIIQIDNQAFISQLNNYYVNNNHYLNNSKLTTKQKADLLLKKNNK